MPINRSSDNGMTHYPTSVIGGLDTMDEGNCMEEPPVTSSTPPHPHPQNVGPPPRSARHPLPPRRVCGPSERAEGASRDTDPRPGGIAGGQCKKKPGLAPVSAARGSCPVAAWCRGGAGWGVERRQDGCWEVHANLNARASVPLGWPQVGAGSENETS
jgi:hypothetical protein